MKMVQAQSAIWMVLCHDEVSAGTLPAALPRVLERLLVVHLKLGGQYGEEGP